MFLFAVEQAAHTSAHWRVRYAQDSTVSTYFLVDSKASKSIIGSENSTSKIIGAGSRRNGDAAETLKSIQKPQKRAKASKSIFGSENSTFKIIAYLRRNPLFKPEYAGIPRPEGGQGTEGKVLGRSWWARRDEG